ncbi:MAG: DUF4350 domain-containing protein [Planctomycetaceae bacterium]
MRKPPRHLPADIYWLAAVAILVLLQFWWLPGDPGTPSDTYSATIEGKRGFFQTLLELSQADLLPEVSRETLKMVPDRPCTLLVLSPDRYPNQHEQQELAEFVMNGGTLLFAPNWFRPTCSIPQLNVRIESHYFHEEDLVQAQVSPPAGKVPAENQSGEPKETESPGIDPLPAEAPETTAPEADSNSVSELPTSKASANAAPSSAPTAEPASESATDTDQSLRDARKKSTLPAADPGLPLDESDEEVSLWGISDFDSNSTLVDGSVPWRTRAALEPLLSSATVLVKSGSGTPQVAAWKYGSGLVVVSASGDVFSNRAMLDDSQAELAVRLVEYANGHHSRSASSPPIVVSEFLNASDSYRGTAVLVSPSLRSGTLQLITIAVLAGWFGFHRFGPPRHVNTFQRRSLTESATAVGNLQFRTSSGLEVLARYLEYFRTQVQRTVGATVHLDQTRIIAVRAGLTEDDVSAGIQRAISLCRREVVSSAEAASAIRQLSVILNRLTGHRAG